MNLGKKLKKERNKKGFTQEELAEILNVSSQAISRWENDAAHPDITLLPILASIFNVTTDYLLDVDETHKQKEINQAREEAYELWKKGDVITASNKLREVLKKYPKSYKLMLVLIQILDHVISEIQDCDSKLIKINELITLAETIMEDCVDINIKNSTIIYLCNYYPEINKTDKAIELAKTLPPLGCTRGEQLTKLYKGKDLHRLLVNNVDEYLWWLVHSIRELADVACLNKETPYNLQEKIKIYEKSLELYKVIYEEDDYIDCHFYDYYRLLGTLYAFLKDKEKTIYYMDQACKYAIMFDKVNGNKIEYKSIIFRNIPKEIGVVKSYKGNMAYKLLDHLTNYMKYDRWYNYKDRYEFIRNDIRFIKIIELLKLHAKEDETIL